MESPMTNTTDLIDRYIAMWNETDGERRRALIARIWTDGGSYVDPLMQGDGPAGIDAMVAGVQARFPGHRFRRTGPVDAHNGHVRFAWHLAPEAGPALAARVDFGVIAPDGRLASITGFLDQVPAGVGA
jgi:hypothetical protein